MKEKNMTFTLTITILLGLIILGVWFYWYEWRPRLILKNCYIEAEISAQNLIKDMVKTPKGRLIVEQEGKAYYFTAQLDKFYRNCRQLRGI